jgi:predicted DNA-binding WGR domain protein
MYLFLQQSAPGPVPPRYVRLSVGRDLLGSWELLRETGQIGGRSQVRREIFGDCDEALAAFEAYRAQYTRRGYAPPESTVVPTATF